MIKQINHFKEHPNLIIGEWVGAMDPWIQTLLNLDN